LALRVSFPSKYNYKQKGEMNMTSSKYIKNVVLKEIVSCLVNMGMSVTDLFDHRNFRFIEAQLIFHAFTAQIGLTYLKNREYIYCVTTFYDNYNTENVRDIYRLINRINDIFMTSGFIYDPEKKVIFTRTKVNICNRCLDKKQLITLLKNFIFEGIDCYKLFLDVAYNGLSIEEVTERYFSEEQ
jgi:hypothetical protein